ncbi:hypothetical protein SBRCBS47491_007757 [Sporothrix bragantina]|uniref:Uncharacterized protein n=1 Tax=Sporothrix bragantina TaxID=671064 RepID=A0ABP0CFS5_9PEZI
MTTAALHGGTAPLAALTTVFTPPCPTSWLVTTTKLPSQYPLFPAAAPIATCDPPNWASNLGGEGFQYYSPAICPDGFEVGPNCMLTGAPRTTEGFPALAADETVAFCVPSGQTCTSDTTDFRGGIWGVLRTATGASVTVTVGPAMQIRWRDVDLSILATHPLTPGLTLAGAATSTPAPPAPTSTTPPAVTPTSITKLTPEAGTSSTQNTDTTSASSSPQQTTTTAAAGFVTLKGKSTQLSSTTQQPITSTLTVVSAGSTFKSTVVTSPTSVAPSPNGVGGSTTSNSTSSSSNKKAFAATITMACLLSIAAAAIIIFLILSRRRYLRQQQQQQQNQKQEHMSGGVLEDGRGAGNNGSGGVSDGSSSIGLSSVGVGAWVQRRKPRWRVAWRRARAWWSSVRLLPWQRSQGPLTGDNLQRLWRRRHRQAPSPIPPPPPQKPTQRARTPLAELPTSERALADFAELEGSPVPEIMLEGEDDVDDGDTDSYMSIQKFKGIPSKRPGTGNSNNVNRLSWMSRLSRYMRGGRSTPGVGGAGGGGRDTPSSIYDDVAAGRSVISRASTRSSRWTRADTASVMTGRGGLDDDDCPYNAVDDIHNESSWAAFSQSREGLGRLLLVKQNGGVAGGRCPDGPPRRGHTRGLSAPNNGSSSNNIPRLPSPAMTVVSDRMNTPSLLSADANRFSRLSNGTFGRMDSFISRDGSRTGDASSGGGGGGGRMTP